MLSDYELSIDTLGAVIADNASNNDTTIAHLYKAINTTGKRLDPQYYCLCCYGYILNLVAQSFLHRSNPEEFESCLDILDAEEVPEQDANFFQK